MPRDMSPLDVEILIRYVGPVHTTWKFSLIAYYRFEIQQMIASSCARKSFAALSCIS